MSYASFLLYTKLYLFDSCSTLFSLANYWVILYGAMLKNSSYNPWSLKFCWYHDDVSKWYGSLKLQTKKSMQSSIPYVVLGILYAYLLYFSWTPETMQLMFASKYWLPEVCINCVTITYYLHYYYSFNFVQKVDVIF